MDLSRSPSPVVLRRRVGFARSKSRLDMSRFVRFLVTHLHSLCNTPLKTCVVACKNTFLYIYYLRTSVYLYI